MNLVSKRPAGRHRRATSRARSATPVALAMVGATAVSASASTLPSHTGSAAGKESKDTQDQATQNTASPQKTTTQATQNTKLATQQKQAAKHRAAAHRAAMAQKAKHQAAVNQLAAKRAAKHRAAAAAHRFELPLNNYTFTSTFGERWGRLHAGIDLAVPIGTPVHSMSTGVVTFAGPMQGYGNAVIIRYWDGTSSLYGHLSSFSAHKGDHVTPGQLVAHSGNTGHSTGPHLHFEIRPKDSVANEMARASHALNKLSTSLNRTTNGAAGQLEVLASRDAMAQAGFEPAPINPLPWLKAHGILPKGAH